MKFGTEVCSAQYYHINKISIHLLKQTFSTVTTEETTVQSSQLLRYLSRQIRSALT